MLHQVSNNITESDNDIKGLSTMYGGTSQRKNVVQKSEQKHYYDVEPVLDVLKT